MSTTSNRNFAAYLATLDTYTHLTPLTSISTSPSSNSDSPQKRPRSDSPDTSVSSIDPTDSFSLTSPYEAPTDLTNLGGGEFQYYSSSTTLSASSTSCTLRSILTISSSHMAGSSSLGTSPVGTSPLVSPSISRPLSRRSSSSGKSVRFARCTNASVFPALSGEEYDRTPIVPSTESESLELPRRKAETEGWIKCLQKRRAADEKAKLGCAAWTEPSTSTSSSNMNSPSLPSERTVEGFHGMVEGKTGGYFVGEERAERMELELEERSRNGDGDDENNDDDMVVDDQEENEDEEDNTSMVTTPKPTPVQVLIEDSSSGGEEESDGFGNTSTREGSHEGNSPPSSISSNCDTVMQSSSESLSLGGGFSMERSINRDDEDDDEEDEEEEETEEEKMRREEEEERLEELERSRKTKARYGICALGKYSRAEVFQSHDSLGGF